jgi:hypothetical protein
MKVKLLSDQSGTYVDSDGVQHQLGNRSGDVFDLPEDLAQDLIRRQQAEPVK